MPIVFIIGRVVFVLHFAFSGLQRLINIASSADYFAHQVAIPPGLSALSTQLESIVGLSTPQMLALLSGAIELAAAALIAFNVGTRAMAIVLIVFTALAVYYGSDFWTMSDGKHDAALAAAVLQISMIGGLIVFVALGSTQLGELKRRDDV